MNTSSTVKCWANTMGDCCDKQSGEHLFSEGLFSDRKIKIRGLPWCQDSEREIGRASAVSNILCKTHNERLSSLDAEAIRLMRTLHQIAEFLSRQKAAPAMLREWKLNGRLLELWFLKTLINMVCVQKLSWSSGDAMNPPSSLVEACFLSRPLEHPVKLLNIIAIGAPVGNVEEFSFAAMFNGSATREIAAGIFQISTFWFFLPLLDVDFQPHLRRLAATPGYESFAECGLGPIRTIDVKYRNRIAHRIKLAWPPFDRSLRGLTQR